MYLWENSKTQGKKSEIEILAPMILYKELSSPKLRQKVPHVHEAVSWSQFPERVSGLCWSVVSQGFALSGLALSPLLSAPSGGRVPVSLSPGAGLPVCVTSSPAADSLLSLLMSPLPPSTKSSRAF